MQMRYVFISVLIIVSSAVHAQWRVGASGGADYNWYSINTQYQTDYRYSGAWGWNAALFTQYNFLPWVGLRAEVETSERNYRFYRTRTYAGTDYITHNTYVHVPLMAQFSFGDAIGGSGVSMRGFLNIGGYAGLWAASAMRGNWYDDMSGKTLPISQPVVFNKEKDQRFDTGLAGGIGIEIMPTDHWSVHIESRCYYSLLSSVKQYMTIKDYRYNTTLTLQAGFSYLF